MVLSDSQRSRINVVIKSYVYKKLYVSVDELYSNTRKHFNPSRNPNLEESDIDLATDSELEKMIESGEIIALHTRYPKDEATAKAVKEISSPRYFTKGLEPKDTYEPNPFDIRKYFQKKP